MSCSTLIQEFFNNQYSVAHRFVILDALMTGARELAGLEEAPLESPAFPSKLLPAKVHQQIMAIEAQDNLASPLLAHLSRIAVTNGDQRPPGNVVRQRKLQMRSTGKISNVTNQKLAVHQPNSRDLPPRTRDSFIAVAAEYFLAPMMNRFWIFLRDEQARERRTNHLEGRGQYRSAGSGLVLNPIVLTRFIQTLAVLVNASQNAPEWLSIIAPDALELAVTVGSKPVSLLQIDNLEGAEAETKEAPVLTACLELALMALDGCVELDGGRSIGLDRTELLASTQEWAMGVFRREEDGARLPGIGGSHEMRLRQATAGVLLKVQEIESRWRRSMVEMQ